ncbi:hypothetical protein ACU635_56780 [[Actinomadura] parvosata]|uniref:hypothetical protein n=1 Tax=[Actinomadura] parvosata TaxID=1955412 RepID=UPI00406CCAD6
MADLDAAAERMSVPAMTLPVAQAGLSVPQRDMLQGMVERLPAGQLQIVASLDPILTMSRNRWDPVLERLPWQVAVVEASGPQ